MTGSHILVQCSRSLPYAPVLRKNHVFRRTAIRSSKTPVIILSRPYISYGSTYGNIQMSFFRAVWTCVSMIPSSLHGWPFCFRTHLYIGRTCPFRVRSGRKHASRRPRPQKIYGSNGSKSGDHVRYIFMAPVRRKHAKDLLPELKMYFRHVRSSPMQ